MKIISSQHYLNWETVEQKINEIKDNNITIIEVPVIPCEIGGEEYGIVIDAHHRMAAAKELGISVDFVETENIYKVTGEDLLEVTYWDGDYYYVETSDPASEKFDLVW